MPTPDHCRRCRYPLGDLPADAPCPECGSRNRQVGPHKVFGANAGRACACVVLGVFMILAGLGGAWPFLLLVPAFGLAAVIFGHLEQRSRRRLELPKSYSTIAMSVLGWIMFLPPTILIALYLIYFILAIVSQSP